MPAVPDLPNWAEILLRIAGIALAAIIAVAAVRWAAGTAVTRLFARRSAEAGAEAAPPTPELWRRVTTVERLVVRVVEVAIVIIATLMVLQLFGIDIGPAVAGLGVAGIAVGLGAQAVIRDWLAGIFVVIENQYNRGDTVQIAGVEGVVEDFSLRRTVLRGGDGTVHNVPNGHIVVASRLAAARQTAAPRRRRTSRPRAS